MTTIGKNIYFDVLNDIVDKYNNSIHSSIKMKPKDVKDDCFVESEVLSEETNTKHPKFKVGDHVRISKYKNIFAKAYTPNWREEVFVINKVKNTVLRTYLINDLNGEEIVVVFMRKNYKRLIRKNLGLKR